MKIFCLILIISGLLAFAGCSVFGNRSQYEEAGHDQLQKEGDIEIRAYEPLVVVQTTIDGNHGDAGNKAFRKLFNYISGNNASEDKIPMTTPVFSAAANSAAETRESDSIAPLTAGRAKAFDSPSDQEPIDGKDSWTYQFVLPTEYTLETAPPPEDPSVELKEISAGKAAVIRFSGRWDQDLRNKKLAELRAWISEQGLEEVSDPRFAAYDPPWTMPALRRNEVLIDVK